MGNFTKFVNNYLLWIKKQNNILECFKNFFEVLGEPIEMGFNNGREFVNKSVSSFLTEKNIKIIKGKPYHPRFQDAVERESPTWLKFWV